MPVREKNIWMLLGSNPARLRYSMPLEPYRCLVEKERSAESLQGHGFESLLVVGNFLLPFFHSFITLIKEVYLLLGCRNLKMAT